MELMSLDDQKDHEIPWTSKNYACSFCKRQFRSAQALGGHINVHRRDRARMRLLPSTLNSECPNHNSLIYPNLSSPASSSFSVRFLPHNPQFLTSSLNSPLNCLGLSSEKDKRMFNFPHDDHKRDSMAKKSLRLGSISMEESGDHLKDYFAQKGKSKESMIRLDLEMGLLNDHKMEDLHVDLELRLGH